MVNDIPPRSERGLVLLYAPSGRRAALAALLALDDRLAGLLRAAREPLVAQMRLTWWHEALRALDDAPPPAEPVLASLAAEVLPRGVTGAALAGQVEGWEALLEDEPLDADRLTLASHARGGSLFAAAAVMLGTDAAAVTQAGQGWALADFAAHLSDPEASALARAEARSRLEAACRRPWPRPARALGALALLARFDVRGDVPPGHPRRAARLALHRLTGR